MEIEYIHEPTDLQCGQAVLAMVLGMDVGKVAQELDNFRETNLKEMKAYLRRLPPLCMLSLETPRCWHWSLYCDGTFYDPEHGVMEDFPKANRKYYWEIF